MPESLPPIVPAVPRVLVLGSMPGVASLRAQQYYAHPRNLFWQMAQWHLGIDRAAPYAARVRALRARGVAVWDVLAACEREGSLDGAIDRASEVPNAIPELFERYASLRAVLLNGRRAQAGFRRHVETACRALQPALALHALPSTSPANQSIPLDERRRAWSVLARYAAPEAAALASRNRAR